METMLTRNWGWMALRGVAALLFGLLTVWYPGLTLAVLVLLFGVYALLDGILTVIAAIANRREEPHWVALLIAGLVGIVIGVLTFIAPGITATVLLYYIAVWAIVAGAAQIAAAIRLRKVIQGEWLLALVGVLSIALGIVLIIRPIAGALAVVVWIGAYAVVVGIAFLALAFRLRAWGRSGRSYGRFSRA